MTAATPIPVVVDEVPSRLLLASDEHFSEIVRELRLMSSMAGADLERGRRHTIDEALDLFAEFREGSRRQAALAVASGRDEVTVRLWLDADAADRLVRYLELLEEIDAWSRREELLTMAAPPEVIRFRSWFANQILSQLLR